MLKNKKKTKGEQEFWRRIPSEEGVHPFTSLASSWASSEEGFPGFGF